MVCKTSILFAEEKTSTLFLKNADFIQNSQVNGQLVSNLQGNVTFAYDNGTITADQATWHRSEQKVLFQNNIIAAIENKHLTCERIDFFRAEKKLIASVNVDFFDPIEQVRVTAQHAEYFFEKKHLTLTVNPKIFHYDTLHADTSTLSSEKMVYDDSLKLATATNRVVFFNQKEQVHMTAEKAEYLPEKKFLTLTIHPKILQFDSTQSETLSIVAEKMIYDDSLKTVFALNDVVMTQGIWKSTCRNAAYNVETGSAQLRGEPWIYYKTDELTGDSVDLFFKNRALHGVSVMRRVKGFQRDITQLDTIFREVTGDSMYMAIADSHSLETIWIYDNAKTLYYSSKKPEYINEAYGKIMKLDFREGKINTLAITDNAEFFYYLDDKTDTGKIDSSGDKILIKFEHGDAVFMTITGAVRGTYFSTIVR